MIVAVVASLGALASRPEMAFVTPVGTTAVNRSYYGSDTRAQSLLVGAALAAVCLLWGPVRTRGGRLALWLAGLTGAVVIVVMWRTVTETSALTFHGGFALLSVATAGVIACVTSVSESPVTRVLSVPPFPYLGRISYGMYLWYLPVLLVMTSGRTHLEGVSLLAARMVVIVVIAAASFHLVETPIRRGALAGWRSWVAVPLAAVTVSVVPLLVPTLSALVPAADAPCKPNRSWPDRPMRFPSVDRCGSSSSATRWPAPSGSGCPRSPPTTAPRSSTRDHRAARSPKRARSGCCGTRSHRGNRA